MILACEDFIHHLWLDTGLLPQIAHQNLFVHVHKTANEPATVVELRHQFVLCVMADIIGFCDKLLAACVKCIAAVIPLLSLTELVS
jgi:hypothetical protein